MTKQVKVTSCRMSTRVFTNDDHDFWEIDYDQGRIYNIVPKGSKVPTGGYLQPGYILKVKGYKEWPKYPAE